jgi:hypothetical protein
MLTVLTHQNLVSLVGTIGLLVCEYMQFGIQERYLFW